MKLRDYLKKKNITGDEFATISGLSAETISRVVNEKRKLEAYIAKKIIDASKGEVTLDDLAFEPRTRIKCECCGRYYWADSQKTKELEG